MKNNMNSIKYTIEDLSKNSSSEVKELLLNYKTESFRIGLIYVGLTIILRCALLASSEPSFIEGINNPSWLLETFILVSISVCFWIVVNDVLNKQLVLGVMIGEMNKNDRDIENNSHFTGDHM